MDFYYLPGSSPCRSVLMAVGVDLNCKVLDLMAGEYLKPDLLKIKPQRSIPTMVDNGFALWESRANMIYLVEKYPKTDSLYPKCPKKRSVVSQRLFIDLGTLYQRFADYYYPQIFAKAPANPDNVKRMEDAFDFLNTILDGQQYVAGDSLTLADVALVATVSTYDIVGFDISKYANVDKCYKHCSSVTPGYELDVQGMETFKKFF